MSRTTIAVVAWLLLLPTAAVTNEIPKALKEADRDGSGRLNQDELRAYFLANDPAIVKMREEDRTEERLSKEADDLAIDALTFYDTDGDTITPRTALDYVDRRMGRLARAEKAKPPKFLWETLRFRRLWIDSVDPGKDKHRQLRPFLVSYSHDSKRAEDKDSFVVLGNVVLFEQQLPLGSADREVKLSPSLAFDVDSAKEATESSMSLGVKAQLDQAVGSDWLGGLSVAATPKYTTDRRLSADIWEFTGAVSASSKKLLRAGHVHWIGGQQKHPDDVWLKLYWVPELRLELGKVTDSAGSVRLRTIEDDGSYTRLVPHVAFSFEPTVLTSRLSIKGDYFHRFDTSDGWDRGFLEVGAQLELVPSFLSLSLLYRNGNKPPVFDRTNAVILGIGIQR